MHPFMGAFCHFKRYFSKNFSNSKQKVGDSNFLGDAMQK